MNIEEIFNEIRNNPKLTYAIIAIVLTLVLIGYIKRWKWATEPTGHRKSMILVEWFGFENYRKIMIGVLIIGIISLLFLLYMA
ncbi:Immunity protein 17 [Pedobacter steynii]|uniref:Immunity protein 17 n=1 Tax=Pedobacter steynii TaxID=430522 RepID=A0A1G9LAU6_9SPHI|nr:immunity 17 family protein [Pedobacter steynii]NQX38796.1 hypothetical protein [Pedobacter steynii]SDL59082.1 Immunity protein 17 [Pedobacter steynii]